MIRLIYTILFRLPWWGYALLAVVLGNITFGMWQSYETRTAEAEIAILQGPPAVTKVGEFNPRLRDVPFQEMRIAGFIRADLGVGRLEGTVPKSYLVLDSVNRAGPLIAVLFVGSDDQAGLPDLVATANANGLVTASGFRRTLDRAGVSGQLRLQGVRREVLLMEAMVGDRTEVLREKGATDLPFLIFFAVLTAAAVLRALYGRNTSRKRKAPRFRKRTNLQAAVPKPAKTASNKPMPTGRANTTTPWGNVAPTATPAPTPAPFPKQGRPVTTTPPVPAEPAFKSVFPGGGSGFRFKSADEIIRQSFGTLSTLTPPTRKDE